MAAPEYMNDLRNARRFFISSALLNNMHIPNTNIPPYDESVSPRDR